MQTQEQKLPRNFWKTVQKEYSSANSDLQTYICHCSPTFKQHWGNGYRDVLCRPAIRTKAEEFLAANPDLNNSWRVGGQGTALFWEQCPLSPSPRTNLLTMFLAFATTPKTNKNNKKKATKQ